MAVYTLREGAARVRFSALRIKKSDNLLKTLLNFMPGQSLPPQSPQYVPIGVPVEKHSKHPGMIHGIISIVCAVTAVLFFPPIFGITGIILGSLALKKGAKALGLVGIILSAVFMVIGLILGYLVSAAGEELGGIVGLILGL